MSTPPFFADTGPLLPDRRAGDLAKTLAEHALGGAAGTAFAMILVLHILEVQDVQKMCFLVVSWRPSRVPALCTLRHSDRLLKGKLHFY